MGQLELKHMALAALICILIAAHKKRQAVVTKHKITQNKDRRPGKWVAEDYETPTPSPYPNWDVEKTAPLPYRAFTHKYNISMGINAMRWDDWIELDNEWIKYHNEKCTRLKAKSSDVHGTRPEARPAAFELLEELRQFLPARYPLLFRSTHKGMENLLTGELHVFRNCQQSEISEDPMATAAKLVQDDLAIMIEGSDGQYRLLAGAIVLPGFWRFKDKVGLSLNDIHTSGDVPKYQEKLQSGMNRFFTKLSCDKPVVRYNYFIQLDDELAWSKLIGPEDSNNLGWHSAPPAAAVEQLYFRSERQSLRRLPKTGAVVFTIRTYFCRITDICQEPHIPRRLLNAVETWTEDVREYRGYYKFRDALLPYLEAKASEQEQAGYVPDNEPSVYPF